METFKITGFGPIADVEVETGDMTILVGPQAAGKSLFLQFLNLILDNASIIKTLRSHGFTVRTVEDLLEHYLGPDMAVNWGEKCDIQMDGKSVDLSALLRRKPRNTGQNTFYIPAQRVLVMEDGWPRNFLNLTSYPYVVKNFSESLRLLMEAGLGKGDAFFPQEGRLKKVIKDKIQEAIFKNTYVKLETEKRKRLVLEINGDRKMQLPIPFWSAGQREFMPLLLGLYHLTPASRVPQKGKIKTVIIEELEAGLHPEAITAVMLAVIELVNRGYKVVVSTHSLHVVEMVWAIKEIAKSNTTQTNKLRAFSKLFDIETPGPDVRKMIENCLTKIYKVFYFKPGMKGGFTISRDITGLDPSEDDPVISGWGGLSEFSSNVVDVVSSLHESD